MGMSARDHKAEVRRFQVGVGKVVRGDMPCDMVHWDKRLFRAQSQALCVADADEQCADKSGGIGHGNGVDVIKGAVRFFQRLTGHPADIFGVAAGGNFGNDSAVEPVFIYLAGDDV